MSTRHWRSKKGPSRSARSDLNLLFLTVELQQFLFRPSSTSETSKSLRSKSSYWSCRPALKETRHEVCPDQYRHFSQSVRWDCVEEWSDNRGHRPLLRIRCFDSPQCGE